MGIAQRVAFFVADGFEELVNPDGGIDGEAVAVEGFEGSRASGGTHDRPESCNSHSGGGVDMLEMFASDVVVLLIEECRTKEDGKKKSPL